MAARRLRPALIAFVGPSGVGKTRLLVRLVRALSRQGLRVAALKHSHHDRFDKAGSDTDLLRRAGALSVAVQGRRTLALFTASPDAGPEAAAAALGPVDIVLCEGFKGSALPKIEIHRGRVSRAFLCKTDPGIVAVVSREAPPAGMLWFGPGQIAAIARLVLTLSGLVARRPGEP